MSLLFMCSLGDDGNCSDTYQKWDTNSRHPVVSTSYGRLGGYGVRVGDWADDELIKTFTMSGDTIIIGFAMRMAGQGGSDNRYFMWGYDSGTIQWNFRINVDRSIEFDDGAGTAEAAKSAAGAIPDDAWCYFECKIKHSSTVGTVDVRINGSSVLSATTVDTIATANTYINRIKIGEWQSSGVGDIYIDDLYILDGSGSSPYNDFLGDVQVLALLPNGNGNSSGMTGSDGNSTDNYLLVDDDPISTADYVESATEGHKDTYAMENLPSSSYDIYGIQAAVIEQKDASGSKYMRTVVRTGSTDYNSASRSLGTSWAGAYDIWEENPNTSLDWTATDIDGIEVGQEVRDS